MQDFGYILEDQLPQLKGMVIQSQAQVHSSISGNSISFKISESHNAFFITSLEYQNEDNKVVLKTCEIVFFHFTISVTSIQVNVALILLEAEINMASELALLIIILSYNLYGTFTQLSITK